jgi:hypothetical protein
MVLKRHGEQKSHGPAPSSSLSGATSLFSSPSIDASLDMFVLQNAIGVEGEGGNGLLSEQHCDWTGKAWSRYCRHVISFFPTKSFHLGSPVSTLALSTTRGCP